MGTLEERLLPPPSASLSEFLDHYRRTVSVHKRSYSSEAYRFKPLNALLGHLALNEISPQHVIAYRDTRLATPNPRNKEKTLAGSTVKLELMLLSHLYSTAITEWGFETLVNPVEKIRKPKTPPGRTRRLTPHEERKLLRAAWRHPNKEFYAIVVLALETACRQGEILGLRWEHIHWRKRTAYLPITKNGESREVPLSRAAYDVLKEYLTPCSEGRVFSYSGPGLKSSWRGFIQGLGIADFHFHDLRHCAVSSLFERGLNTIEVASISGHKSMSMLKRYAHLSTHELVKKLDPKPLPKKERPLLRDHLTPYPAVVTAYSRRVQVDFPDFVDLSFAGTKETEVMDAARATLLRRVVRLLCDGGLPPVPSPPESIRLPSAKSRVELVSPL